MVSISLLAQLTVDGLIMGILYAQVGIGLVLLFGTMNFLNIAHGTVFLAGAYAAYWGFSVLGLNIFFTFLLVVGVAVLIGVLMEKLVASPLRERGGRLESIFIATVGIQYIIRYSIYGFFGGDYKKTPEIVSGVVNIGYRVSTQRLVAAILSVIIIGLLYLFIWRTKMGKSIRGVAQNKVGAQLVGVNIKRAYLITFILSVLLVAVAGFLVSPIFTIIPAMGGLWLLRSFIIITIAGLKSIGGALVGGLILGVSESVSQLFIPPQASLVVAMVIMAVIILIKPKGLFG